MPQASTLLQSSVLMQPQERNTAGKIFGGYLMRQACPSRPCAHTTVRWTLSSKPTVPHPAVAHAKPRQKPQAWLASRGSCTLLNLPKWRRYRAGIRAGECDSRALRSARRSDVVGFVRRCVLRKPTLHRIKGIA